MAQCNRKSYLAFCLLLLVSTAFSKDLHRQRRQAGDDSTDDRNIPSLGDRLDDARDNRRGPVFSAEEFGEKLRELVDRDQPERKKGPGNQWDTDGDGGGFTALLERLEDLSEGAPDDLQDFDATPFLNRVLKPGAKQNALNSQCLKNPLTLQLFLREMREAIHELREDMREQARDAVEDMLDDVTDTSDTMDPMGSDMADSTDDVTTNDNLSPQSQEASNELDSLDMEDIFEKLSENSMECMKAFFDDDDEEVLCRQLSHQSSRVFAAFLRSGVDCSDYLEDSDDLDEAHQEALLAQLRQTSPNSWTSQDLQRALRMAPDAIDDDFLEELTDDILDDNMDLLGRVAARRGANPSLQLAFRQRLMNRGLGQLDSSAITMMGRGILQLTEDELEDLDPQALLNADIDDLFDDDDDDDDDATGGKVNDDDDDDDDDEMEGRRLALGRRMKQAQPTGPRQIGRIARFLYDDLEFLDSTDPEDLYEAALELRGLDLDEDEAANIFQRMSQSSQFPALNQFSRENIQRLQSVMPGMQLSQIRQLPTATIRTSLPELRDIDFEESQSRELLEDLFDDEDELRRMTATGLRGLGKLLRGLETDDIEDMDDNVITEVLDDMDHLELSDAQKRILANKALNAANKQGVGKLLSLPSFAQSLSVADMQDTNDDDVVRTFTTSTTINWRASQASALVSKLKNTLKGRPLRMTDIPKLGTLTRGLLLKDLDDVVDMPGDVDDVADILGDDEDDLSSALVDRLVELIEERDDMDNQPEIKVTAQYVAQKGVFLAYLPPSKFEKLEFDDEAKKAFVLLLAKMDTRKLPRAQLQFLSEELLDMMEDKAGESKDDGDLRKLKQLGHFALGLTATRINNLSPQALVKNMAVLGTLPFNRAQAKALLDKMDDLPDWECDGRVLVNAGPLLMFADDDKIEKLCDNELASSMAVIEKRLEKRQERLEDRHEQGLWREDSASAPDSPDTPDTPDLPGDDAAEDATGRQRLVKKMMVAALISRASRASSASSATGVGGGRKRRATPQDLTCSILRLMRQDVVQVDMTALTSMPDGEFKDCLEVLGNASKWHDKDLPTLLSRAVQVMGTTPSWTNEMIRQAGVLVSAMSPSDIQNLQLTGVDAMNSVAKHARLRPDQLMAGFGRWLLSKKSGSIAQITPGEFAAMSEFVCGLTVDQIRQLPLDVFKRSLDVVGRAKSCSQEQRTAYAALALQAFGDVTLNWSPAIVSDMGHVLGGLSAPSIQQLTTDQIALIRPTVVANLPESTLKAMTTTQLGDLSTNQVNALSKAHYDALTNERQQILDTKATISFNASHPAAGSSADVNSTEITQTTEIMQDSTTASITTTTVDMTTTTATTQQPMTDYETTTPAILPTTVKLMTTTTTTTTTTQMPTTVKLMTTTTTPLPTTVKIITTPFESQTTSTLIPELPNESGLFTTEEATTMMPEIPTSPKLVQTSTVAQKDKPVNTQAPDTTPIPSTPAPETKVQTTRVEKPVETSTVQYIQTTTRKAIAISTEGVKTVSTSSKSVMPDSSVDPENPWVQFSSPKTDGKEKSTSATTRTDGKHPSKPSGPDNSVSTKGKHSDQSADGSSSGSSTRVIWSMTSLFAALLVSLLL